MSEQLTLVCARMRSYKKHNDYIIITQRTLITPLHKSPLSMFIGRKRRRVRFNDFSLRCSNFSSSQSTSDAQLLVLELRRSDNTTISDEQMMLTEMLSYWRTTGLVCRRTECDRFDLSTAKSTSWFDWYMSITQFGKANFETSNRIAMLP